MTKLSQHGSFDDSLEASVREQLLTEFNEQTSWADRCSEWTAEDFGEIPDGFDFAACQRPDGSVYPIASGKQCRRGVPISVSPGDEYANIVAKGLAAGLKVRSIFEDYDRLRAEKRVKDARGETLVRSLARRLNERIDRKQQPAIEQVAKKTASRQKSAILQKVKDLANAQRSSENKPSQRIDKRFLQRETTQKLQQYLNDRRLYPYQRKAIQKELKRREGITTESKKTLSRQEADVRRQMRDLVEAPGKFNARAYRKLGQRLNAIKAQRKEENKTPGPSSTKPYGLDKDAQIIVNKKLLGQDTSILQRILQERSLNPKQRAKIEEEVGARGETPAQAKRLNKREVATAGKEGKGWNFIKGAEGYDPIQAFARQDNERLAEGAMGEAFRTKGPPPGVVKKGQIGEFETEAWQKLQKTGRVPEFHGAAVSPNLNQVERGLGGHVRESKGFLGIGEAKGKPVSALGLIKPAERRAVIDEYIRTRKDIHLAGVAHNDMHGGNVFYDRSTGKMQAIDFGLAQVSYKAALLEALSTRGGDWQADGFISRWKPSGDEPPAYNQFLRNQRALLRVLDNQGYDSDWIIQYGIRTKPEKIDELFDGMSEADALTYLKVLYKNV